MFLGAVLCLYQKTYFFPITFMSTTPIMTIIVLHKNDGPEVAVQLPRK